MSRRGRIGFGAANLAFAAFLLLVVFRGLPTRWWVVDSASAITAALMIAGGAALLANHKHAAIVARAASAVTLTLGLSLVAGLAITAGWLWGTYGPVGKGGAAIFGLVVLLAVPYAVVFPAAELLWIGPPPRRAAKGARGAEAA